MLPTPQTAQLNTPPISIVVLSLRERQWKNDGAEKEKIVKEFLVDNFFMGSRRDTRLGALWCRRTSTAKVPLKGACHDPAQDHCVHQGVVA